MIILITIIVYFCSWLLVSFLTGKKNDNETFFLANRQSRWYVVAFGMIGTSISGVSFISVPGWVATTGFTYMQMVFGFFFGYVIIAEVLLPLYYKLKLTSIYTYLNSRFGIRSYKTGALYFLLSKSIGAAVRLYMAAIILQEFILKPLGINIPFTIIISAFILLIWLYSFRNGIKTIIWTDSLQTLFMLLALVLIIWQLIKGLNLNLSGAVDLIANSSYSRMFVFDDFMSKQYFWKQFLSGVFITIAMTGLDQDMMQKNLTCRTLREAKKNMYSYGIMFIPINLLFLGLGVLMYTFAAQNHITLPASSDHVLPMLATQSTLGLPITIFFTVGLLSAAFSSADSALASLCTSFYVDILGKPHNKTNKRDLRVRTLTHIGFCILFVVIALAFHAFNNRSLIDAIYTIVSYTYGPLLGLFAFGLFCKKKNPNDRYVPFVAIASPIFCYLLNMFTQHYWHYTFGYELLLFNGLITFFGLFLITKTN